jgi:muconolactone D-isomerase
MEYLVTMTTHVPAGTPEQALPDVRAGEAARASELAPQGYLLRPWRSPLLPGKSGRRNRPGRPPVAETFG